MKREVFRLKIANWLNDRFPQSFCWAGLVTCAYSAKPFWKIIYEWNDNRGCQKDGEETSCYCGKFSNPDYYTEQPAKNEGLPF